MFKATRVFMLLCLFAAGFSSLTARAAPSNVVDVLTVKGVINPVVSDYIARGVKEAEDSNATAVVIRLDTPGGLDTSMRDIVQTIVNSSVPVVVYVSPSGARAASAGVFITVAAHVAAMAPNTNIGAAHPVSMDGQQISSTMEEKVVNDAAAYIRSITEQRGRNMNWAEQAVRESVSATEQEALDLNVVDLVADNMGDLLTKLNGREVRMIDGSTVTLNTANAYVQPVPMSSIEDFLLAISDPNIAYLLMSLATLGIMVELFHPGLVFPGIIGAICLLIALFSLGMLPVNYTGVLLIVLAVGLFIGEALTTTFGIFTAGGIASLVLGSLILFKGGPLFRVNPWLIGGVALSIAALFGFVISRVWAAHKVMPATGWEELIDKPATVVAALAPEGMVLFRGEHWKAVSEEGPVEPGEEVVIRKVENLRLHVTRQKEDK